MERKNAVRAAHSYEMRLRARPEEVFPLLCPVREHEWVDGWQARIVFSNSGFAELGCVFTTALPGDAERVWTVSRYEPPRAIGFVVVAPGSHVMTIEVRLRGGDEDDRTVAEWTYVFTSLSESGDAVVAGGGHAHQARMRGLEAMLGRFLARQGGRLAGC